MNSPSDGPLVNPKLLGLEAAVAAREGLRGAGRRLVLTNGCFDLLHTGHLYLLQESARLGDTLWVALNGDAGVRTLKGPGRPVLPEDERAYALGALACVGAVVLFHTPRLTAEIRALQPDIYVKGGDYTPATLPPEELAALEECGADIRFVPFLPGFSTTDLIARINAAGSVG